MPDQTIRIGLLGAGVVGEGIVRLLRDNATSIERRLGAPLEVARIVAKDPSKKRNIDPALLSFDARDVLDDESVDVVVEVIGGLNPAHEYVRTAIERKKQVVTANKALLAEHGHDLIGLAEAKGVDLYFEAAVAGGIPIIRLLREALSADRVTSLYGIVNGTSNYILSRMAEDKLGFAEALKEAQAAGYAEADPTLDVTGGDAAHKLTILAALAFGARVDPAQLPTDGIEKISAVDIDYVDRFGYVIKPLAVGRLLDSGALDLRVHPALVPKGTVLASIGGALNVVLVHGAMVGPCMTSGLGAGAAPTAMSVVSDIVDVARNLLANARGRVPSRAFLGENIDVPKLARPGNDRARFYLRFLVRDRPGILARIAGVLGAFDVSIEQMVQDGLGVGDAPVAVVMLTHDTLERNLKQALREIRSLHDVTEPACALRIESGHT
ncbi:MAG: homoserine dehydrogenase [Myxococcota bacterium]